MKKLFLIFVLLMLIPFGGWAAQRPDGQNTQYGCTALNTGVLGSLNFIKQTGDGNTVRTDGTPNQYDLKDGDSAIVTLSTGIYKYIYIAASTQATSSPTYIRPIDYSTSGVWLRVPDPPHDWPNKTTPVDGDSFVIGDSEASNAAKSVSIANLWSNNFAAKVNAIISGLSFTAADISFTPVGTIAATDAQAAIAEVAEEATQTSGITRGATGIPDKINTQNITYIGSPTSARSIEVSDVNMQIPAATAVDSNGLIPISVGVSGLGTGIAAALAVNPGSAGAPILYDGAGGTPSAMVATNVTGLPPATGITKSLPTYSSAQTLSWATNGRRTNLFTNSSTVEVTLWDCETANIDESVGIWASDASLEGVPASGDHFVLFDGTALDANDEIDFPAGYRGKIVCIADDTWAVHSETATSTDGGVAD